MGLLCSSDFLERKAEDRDNIRAPRKRVVLGTVRIRLSVRERKRLGFQASQTLEGGVWETWGSLLPWEDEGRSDTFW